jgi:hypothetical protein
MKVVDIDDEKKLAAFYDKRMAQEVDGEVLGDEFKGYVFRCVPQVGDKAGQKHGSGFEASLMELRSMPASCGLQRYADRARSSRWPHALPHPAAGSLAATTSRASPWLRACWWRVAFAC